MSEIDFKKEEILKFATLLGLGFYRVTEDGQFVECNLNARKIFGIPQEEKDILNYSIKDLYVVPAERDLRIRKLMKNKWEPLSGSLSMRINDENKLLFDICRYDESYGDKGTFVGLVSEIENSTIFPKMFGVFPMGLYELDNQNRVARVNKKLVEILEYNNENQILNRPIKDFYEDERYLDEFNQEIIENGIANKIIRLQDANNKIIEVEFFSQNINEYESPRWGMVTDVTRRESYYRTLQRMPTGFFHIENERITQCNDHFARILGFKKKEDAIGIDTRKYFVDKEVMKEYFQNLEKASEKDEAVQGYEFKIRTEDGKIITVSVDSHLVKNSNGKVIGREGTIRDISDKVALREKIKETEKRLEKTTADINKLIHTFLHPVIKFYGNSELLSQVSKILQKSIHLETPSINDTEELGKKFMAKLTELRDNIPDIGKNISYYEKKEKQTKKDELDPLVATTLKEKLTKILNVFDYTLKTEKSEILLERTIRDTALWVLEELDNVKYFDQNKLKPLVKKDFIEFLQDILFNHLTRGASILVGETEIMKREVEALRAYIGMKKERKYAFAKHDMGRILEENVERFKPVFLEDNIEIDYKSSGNLTAEISKNDFDRVICNLFHNAKKYSHKGGKRRFVKVRARELQPENQVEFFIQSYGVPIKKEEIENETIWDFGYRGEMAYSSDRDGTGVGLADARDVIKAHEGEIFITSDPTRTDGNPREYKVPYLTTVKIRIPRTQKKKEKGVLNGN